MSFKDNLAKAKGKGGKPEEQEGKGQFPGKGGGFKKAAANAKKKCGKKGC